MPAGPCSCQRIKPVDERQKFSPGVCSRPAPGIVYRERTRTGTNSGCAGRIRLSSQAETRLRRSSRLGVEGAFRSGGFSLMGASFSHYSRTLQNDEGGARL